MNEVGKVTDRRFHRGLVFELWTSQGAWFWRLQEPRDTGGVIGAAGSEAEATEEARATIDGIEAKAARSKIDTDCADARRRLACAMSYKAERRDGRGCAEAGCYAGG
jgi:hypothetical protein